jgi:glycogen operon protein
LRGRQQRNFIATLMLSLGVPMLLGGDEFGRTQQGNNNAWCQDNELSWFDWEQLDESLLEFTRTVVDLRRREPVFRRRDFFVGEERRSDLPDVMWLRPDGDEMTEEDWGRGDAHALAVFLNGEEIPTHDRYGNPIEGASFLLIFNAHHEPLPFTLAAQLGENWLTVLTSDTDLPDRDTHKAGDTIEVADRSMRILRRR